MLAVERVPRDEISSYGVIATEPDATLGDGVYQVRDLVEKPPRDEAPSDLAIIGRYILTPDIFPALAATKSDRTGEIQLTNGLRELLKTRPIYACEVKGVRHDTGNKLGFLKAVVYFALRRPDLADKFSAYLHVARPRGAGRQALDVTTGLRALTSMTALDERVARARCDVVDDVAVLLSDSCRRLGLVRLLGLRRTSRLSDFSDFSALSDFSDFAELSPSAPFAVALSAFAAPVLILLRVVGDVQAAALELKGGRRQQLVDGAAALRARVERADRKTSESLSNR